MTARATSKRKYTKRTPKMPPAAAGPAFNTADEPISAMDEPNPGLEDAAEAAAPDPLASLLADPRLAAMLDKLVAERAAQMLAPATAAPSLDGSAFAELAKTLGHMIEVNAQQQPGYIKPLPAEEVDRRLAGRIEMEALLRDYETRGLAPLWSVGRGGFFECANVQEFKQDDRIRTYLPPTEDMIPENEFAANVHRAMMQHLGAKTPDIGDLVAQRQRESRLPPIVTGALQPARGPGLVEVVGKAPPAPRRRVMGTIQEERINVDMADRVRNAGGAAGAPVGPSFAEAG